MEKENLFDGQHFITAQVIIKADDFAKEMLGENPQPRDLENFIKDHASLMDIVYGSADIIYLDLLNPRFQLTNIEKKVISIKNIADALFNIEIDKKNERLKPWYKRLFCK